MSVAEGWGGGREESLDETKSAGTGKMELPGLESKAGGGVRERRHDHREYPDGTLRVPSRWVSHGGHFFRLIP